MVLAGEATVSVTTKSQLSMITLTKPTFTRETALAMATAQEIIAKPLRKPIANRYATALAIRPCRSSFYNDTKISGINHACRLVA
jgi:hypothetical protein